MLSEYFNNMVPDVDKLLKFGFKKLIGEYVYETELLEGDFSLFVTVSGGCVKTKLVETDAGEEYTLHLTDAEGSFVGQVREAYLNILEEIIEKCFEKSIFKSEFSHKVIEYIRSKYQDELEYLWEKFPDNAVARRKDNSKWYLAILTVVKNRLGFDSEEKIEIIDLRADEEILPNIVGHDGIYPGYHMNKKHWITIILDGSVPLKKLYSMIDESYNLAGKKR